MEDFAGAARNELLRFSRDARPMRRINEQGVAFECATQAECDALLSELETHFGPQRFSNNATAFETVKAYVLERTKAKA